MSTDMYLRCLSHNPPIKSNEVGHNESYLGVIRDDIKNRETIVKMMKAVLERDGWPELADNYANSRAWFLYNHPECEFGIIDEYRNVYPIEVEDENDNAISARDTPLGRVISTSEDETGFTFTFGELTQEGKKVLRSLSVIPNEDKRE